MGFFDKLQKVFQHRPVEDLHTGLLGLGIDAKMAEHGRAEKYIECDRNDRSLGIIEILKGSICWVNLIERRALDQVTYHLKYGIRDPRLRGAMMKLAQLRIKSVRRRTFPLVGKAVDLHWKGNDLGLGIIDRLNSDILIKHPIISSGDITIRAHGYEKLWVMSYRGVIVPSRELWNCYEAIAQHLLSQWPK